MTHGLSIENDQKAAKVQFNAQDPHKQTIVLVGIMGAGKSSVGRRLAQELKIPFFDSDDEVEKAASMTIPEIFSKHGEEEFRRVEARVIERLLEEPRMILATGGGAFMNEATREIMLKNAITVWLNADLETLWRRVSKKGGRPLLKKENPKQVLADLLTLRKPIYALADYEVASIDGPHKTTVDAVRSALNV